MAEGAQRGLAPEEEVERRLRRERILRVLLTSEARQRLTNIKMVKPEVARAIEDQVIQLAASGKLKHAITDEGLKQFLSALQQPKKEFKIRWA